MSGGTALLSLVGTVAAPLTIRMVLGPSLADRAVALDYVTVTLVALASLLAIAFDDLGLALALIGFLATVAFARHAERPPSGFAGGEERAGD